MLKNKQLLFLITFFCCTLPGVSAEMVIIPVTKTSTVADLFTYIGENGEKHLNIPKTPHFKYSMVYTYPNDYSNNLTLSAFIQFIKKGHLLFDQGKERTKYEEEIETFIGEKRSADDLWFKYNDHEKYKKKLLELEKTEQRVIHYLEKLPLDPNNCEKLSAILSEQKNKSLFSSFFLPYLSSLSNESFLEEVTIQNLFWYWLKSLGLLSIIILPAFIIAEQRQSNPTNLENTIVILGFLSLCYLFVQTSVLIQIQLQDPIIDSYQIYSPQGTPKEFIFELTEKN